MKKSNRSKVSTKIIPKGSKNLFLSALSDKPFTQKWLYFLDPVSLFKVYQCVISFSKLMKKTSDVKDRKSSSRDPYYSPSKPER